MTRPVSPTALLAAAASPVLAPGQRTTLIRSLPLVDDWDGVIEAGYRHGVLPLLHTHLQALGLEGDVPEAVRRRLAERREVATRHALLLTLELRQLTTELEAAGIRTLPLKGASVGERLYPEPGLRESGDLDVLVPASRVREAAAIVAARGYEPWEPLPEADGDIRLRTEYSVSFTHPASSIDVDLHWHFARSVFPTGLSADLLFERATANGDGGGSPQLCPEDLLLVLSIHGCKHGPTPWPKLKWVGDLAGFLGQHPDFDWDDAFRHYERVRGDRMVLVGLAVAERLLGCELPAPVRDRLTGVRGVSTAAKSASDALLQERDRFTLAERVGFDLAVRSRVRDRVMVLWRRLFTPTKRDRDQMALPWYLGWLYLPLRLGRLLRQYALNPARIRRLWSRDP